MVEGRTLPRYYRRRCRVWGGGWVQKEAGVREGVWVEKAVVTWGTGVGGRGLDCDLGQGIGLG